MAGKKRARTCATTPKKRQRSARQAAQPPPAQEPTLPELPCVLWHKIFRDAAADDKSVENLARLRLVHKATARDFEFKIFSEAISRFFDHAVEKRNEAYQQWLVDSRNNEEWDHHMRHSQTYGRIHEMKGRNSGGVFAQLVLYELAEESGALGDMWGKRRGGMRTRHGGMAQACIKAVKRAFSEARPNIRGY